MPRPVDLRTRFTLIEQDTDSAFYAVQLHRGQVAVTVGRLSVTYHYAGHRPGTPRRASGWSALRMGGNHWTPRTATRNQAVADLLERHVEDDEYHGASVSGLRYRPPAYVADGLTLGQAIGYDLARTFPTPRRPRPTTRPEHATTALFELA